MIGSTIIVKPFSPPIIEEPQPKVSPINEMISLKKLVKEICSSTNKIHNLNELCAHYNVKRRGFYDFLSIGSVFKICVRHTNDTFEWLGFLETPKVLEQISTTVLHDKKDINIKEYFDCSTNSSLQNIALNVIKLFFYLGVKLLDLRQVAKLFSQGGTKYKTMLRKLYTVAAGLELAEIIEKTNKVAEIKFIHCLPAKNCQANPLDLLSMLNSKEELVAESVYEQRRKIYNDLTQDRRYLPIMSGYEEFQSVLNPALQPLGSVRI